MDAKFRGEEALRASGLNYTVVRPGGLKDGPAGQKRLVIGQGDRSSGAVNRADVAAVCVAALKDAASANKVTLEVVGSKENEGGGGGGPVPSLAEQLKGVFAGLKKDTV